MDGFTQIFQRTEENYKKSGEKLYNFRFNRELYGFCINEGGLDEQSINYSIVINEDLTNKFLQQTKSLIGYELNKEKYLQIDDLDSKHILQLTFLFNNNKINYNRIVEIGGGFGNMLRLCNNIISYDNWDIIDIPHMSELQKYYLENEIKDISKISFLNAYNYKNYKETPIDLVLGTHSVSEFSWDIFVNYFENVIKYSKNFYMGYQKFCPSPQLIQMKENHISSNGFIIEKKFEYVEKLGANVCYTLFKNNKYI